MNKLIVIGIMGLFLISCASSYCCIYQEDIDAVKEFKSKMNILALKNDIAEHNITEDAFNLKLKYFNPCKYGS